MTDDEIEDAREAEETRRLADIVAKEKAWRSVLASEGGRLIVAQLLTSCGWLYPSYVSGDTHATAYREGQRSMGQPIYEVVRAYGPEGCWESICRLVIPANESLK